MALRVLHRADPLAPQRSGQALPDREVWTSVPLVAPDACSHEETICAECRRDGWSDYYVEGRDVPAPVAEVACSCSWSSV